MAGRRTQSDGRDMAFSSEIEKLERRWQENPLGLTFAPLAEAYRKAGDPGRALELLQQGLTQHPNYVPAHIVRGRCHLDAQSDSDAELAFLRVTELDPENVIALKGLAELSERAGRIPEAVHRLELLLDVDRNNEEARGQLDRVKELLANSVMHVPLPVEVPPASVTAETPVPVLSMAPVAEPEFPAAPTPPQPVAPEHAPEAIGTFDGSSLGDLELESATQLTSGPSHEYQIESDAETLRPSDQRIADIILGTEPPEDFPIHEGAYGRDMADSPPRSAVGGGDSVDVLLGEDYSALMAYRDGSSVPGMEPPALEETVFGQLALMADLPVSSPDVLPPPPPPPFEQQTYMAPPPAPEPEPEAMPMMASEPAPDAAEPARALESVAPLPVEAPMPEPPQMAAPDAHDEPVAQPELSAAAPEPEPTAMVDDYVPLGDLGAPTAFQPAAPQAEEPEPASAEEPELVVTETMAEIFLRQGHRELAFAVYAQLAQREPDNQRIAAALASLTPEPRAAEAPAPRFAASDTGGRSVGQLFGSLLARARPSVAPTIHPPAFEQPKRVSGEPTRPAQESLSLSSVFGEESAPSRPAGTAAENNAGEPSFDEFFAPATGPAAEVELPRTPESDAAGAPAQVPEDLEQFNAWLRGLKR